MFLRSLISPVCLGFSVVALTFTSAHAQTHIHKTTGVKTPHHQAAPGKSPSTRAYEAAMEKMHHDMRVPLSGNADVDFARQMIPHHQAAVDMAKIQLKHGRDERLKKFNEWIIFAQELEIAYMKHWLARRDNGAEIQGAKDYFGEAMATMHHGMMIDYTGDADVDYVRGMIPHHQGAVDMAGIWMTLGTDPDLKPLSNEIFNSQTYEIGWMQRWLTRHTQK